jgi:hypothetical protein
LSAAIGFVNYFDGYESLLFQNGLFHSILFDMTSSKFTVLDLQILTYEESIDQDYFNTVLQFIFKTSSFKDIPIHLLNKVLELPENGVYPYRIDNVLFSLKKKRILDESTLNELVLPRLVFEIENLKNNNFQYLHNRKSHPSVFERTNLIIKIFKILFSICKFFLI